MGASTAVEITLSTVRIMQVNRGMSRTPVQDFRQGLVENLLGILIPDGQEVEAALKGI